MQGGRFASAVALALAVVSPGAARGQPGAQPLEQPTAAEPPRPTALPDLGQPREPAYTWQIVAADAFALGAGFLIANAASRGGERELGDWATATWGIGFLGSAAVHGYHGRGARFFAGASARLLAPPAGSLLGLTGYCVGTGVDNKDGCAGDGARFGFWGGLAGAVLVDSFIASQVDGRSPDRGWYGTSTLAVDAAGLALGVYALANRKADSPDEEDLDAMLALGTGHYIVSFIGAPWVHVAHGEGLRALGSFGMRAFFPGLGAAVGLIGHCAATGGASGCIDDGAGYGLLGGSLIAAAIDAAWLTWDERGGFPQRVVTPLPYARITGDSAELGFVTAW